MIVLGVWPLTAAKLPALSETGSQQASGRPPVEDRALRLRYLGQSQIQFSGVTDISILLAARETCR
jgi:hypothetical protein